MSLIKKVLSFLYSTCTRFFAWLKKSAWKKRVAVILGGILILIVIIPQLGRNTSNGYVFEKVTRQSVTEVVTESGNVTTAGRTDVYSPSKGIVAELYVKNGDIVGIDQPLFKIVSTATEDEKASTYADLTAAQSALKTAEQTKIALQAQLEQARQAVLDAQQDVDDLKENRNNGRNNPATGSQYTQLEIDSIESGLTSERLDFNTVEKKYVEAGVSINSAQAALRKASLAYESTVDRVVKSPTIGTVSNLSVTLGGNVSPQTTSIVSTASSSQPVLTIANFSSNQIVLEVNESDISKLKVGQKAEIDPDAVDDKTYHGVITQVDDIGTDNDDVIVYNVYIEITDSDNRLKSGMTVDVNITTQEIADTLAVPNAAIKAYQGGKAVRKFNHEKDELEFVKVETGLKGETHTQILSGIEEGQEIVVSLTNEKIERSGGLGF